MDTVYISGTCMSMMWLLLRRYVLLELKLQPIHIHRTKTEQSSTYLLTERKKKKTATVRPRRRRHLLRRNVVHQNRHSDLLPPTQPQQTLSPDHFRDHGLRRRIQSDQSARVHPDVSTRRGAVGYYDHRKCTVYQPIGVHLRECRV